MAASRPLFPCIPAGSAITKHYQRKIVLVIGKIMNNILSSLLSDPIVAGQMSLLFTKMEIAKKVL
jgi:hypothetical protein